MLIAEVTPILPSLSRHELLKRIVEGTLFKVKETVKLIAKNCKGHVSIKRRNNPESFDMESPFEKSLEISFGPHLAKYIQDKQIPPST